MFTKTTENNCPLFLSSKKKKNVSENKVTPPNKLKFVK